MDAVVAEFGKMYGVFDIHEEVDVDAAQASGRGTVLWEEIRKGVEELRSKEWTYGQTPRFSFNSHETTSEVDAALLPPTSVRQSWNFSNLLGNEDSDLDVCHLLTPFTRTRSSSRHATARLIASRSMALIWL
jgi:hypothetical protein